MGDAKVPGRAMLSGRRNKQIADNRRFSGNCSSRWRKQAISIVRCGFSGVRFCRHRRCGRCLRHHGNASLCLPGLLTRGHLDEEARPRRGARRRRDRRCHRGLRFHHHAGRRLQIAHLLIPRVRSSRQRHAR